ncbi:helix-turn-helix domain-containing protein, partial [Eubacterium aggregans]|uniref:helix-turn-helix domain-containing protein n=1 Tax=Eubacterium aggregans TaxID=81409 RepID=UPI003F2C90EE
MLNIKNAVDRIAKITSERGMTSKAIGDLLGIKKGPLTDWKNGKSKPTLEQIVILCEYFEVSADYILFGKITDCDLIAFQDYDITDEEIEILQKWRELNYSNKIIIKGKIFEVEQQQEIAKEGSNFYGEKVAE